ncbi:MAG: flagellar hook capping protein [Bermanella sp.]|nr:flagellar hook capping protein [Bermanella sp.]|tara:strand:+ start:615 stop:1403 length:789 start_codon:yes stop_codon:yes gene_type:complete
MADVTGVGSSQAALDQYAKKETDVEKSNELGKNDFLKLLVAQMNNQNPLEPQDNTEFVAQLAQFSSVEGIDNLNSTVDDMASELRSSQALQASSLVGQSVVVPSNEYGFLQNGDLIASYSEIPATTMNVSLQVKNKSGQTLETIDLGYHEKGPMSLRWDGANLEMDGEIVEIDRSLLNRQEYYVDEEGNQVLDDAGKPIPVPYPVGEYKFEITASIDGKSEGIDTAMSGKVDSVTLGANNQITLNLAGGTKAPMTDVQQILN